MVDEIFVCYDSCLPKSIHSFGSLHIDKALVVNYVQHVILVDDFLWYSCYEEFYILWVWESIVEVKNVYRPRQIFLLVWTLHW